MPQESDAVGTNNNNKYMTNTLFRKAKPKKQKSGIFRTTLWVHCTENRRTLQISSEFNIMSEVMKSISQSTTRTNNTIRNKRWK